MASCWHAQPSYRINVQKAARTDSRAPYNEGSSNDRYRRQHQAGRTAAGFPFSCTLFVVTRSYHFPSAQNPHRRTLCSTIWSQLPRSYLNLKNIDLRQVHYELLHSDAMRGYLPLDPQPKRRLLAIHVMCGSASNQIALLYLMKRFWPLLNTYEQHDPAGGFSIRVESSTFGVNERGNHLYQVVRILGTLYVQHSIWLTQMTG